MADELRHSIVDSILAWIRSGIAAGMTVIAGFFTYFAWYYKEVLIPSTAPVNVTTELIVKEAGSKSTTSKSNEELQAIELNYHGQESEHTNCLSIAKLLVRIRY